MVHLAAVALMWMAVVIGPRPSEPVPVRFNTFPTPLDRPDPRLKPTPQVDVKVDTDFVADALVNPAPVTVVPDMGKIEPPIDDLPVAPTTRPAEAIAEYGDGPGSGLTSILSVSGPGSPPSLMALRIGNRRKQAALRHGSTPEAEAAVEAGLLWFAKHQGVDGGWDPERYYLNCIEGAKCEPGRAYGRTDQTGVFTPVGNTNVAITGYAVLCFLGAGYDPVNPNRYRETVAKGLRYLIGHQDPASGSFGRNYEHAIATMALAEAYGMSWDSTVGLAAQKAVGHLVAMQNRNEGRSGLGWDYTGPTRRNDSSVTGWNVMALKSAYAAHLEIGRSLEGAGVWLEKHWRASNQASLVRAGYVAKEAAAITARDQSRFGYVWTTGDVDIAPGAVPPPGDAKPAGELKFALSQRPNAGHASLESVGLACGIFLGRPSGDPLVESLANTVMEHQMPASYPCNIYYLYYNTLSLYQLGGERWARWNAQVRDLLVRSQVHTGDCREGSWGPEGSFGVGRTLSTAFNVLSLEVYYRYVQMRHR